MTHPDLHILPREVLFTPTTVEQTAIEPQAVPESGADEVEAIAKGLCKAYCCGAGGGVPWSALGGWSLDGYRAEARFVLGLIEKAREEERREAARIASEHGSWFIADKLRNLGRK